MRDHDSELASLAAGQHGVFSIQAARAVGLTQGDIDERVGTRWVSIHAGAYRVAGAPATWRGDLFAATMAAGSGSAISHRSSGALYELPGGRRELVELSCIRWRRTIKPGLVVH